LPEQSKVQVVQAVDGSVIRELSQQPWADVENMIAWATRTYAQRTAWLSPSRRQDILLALAKLVAAEAESFARLIAREGGKPLTDARIEVARAISGVELAADEVSQLTGRPIPMDLTAAGVGRIAHTVREPIGVVVAISAFNHPLNLIVHQVATAIAAGCPVIVKPDLRTPLCCLRFVELAHEAGLPLPWCQVCIVDNVLAERLATDPRVALLSFIGSARVGWKLRRQLAPGTRCVLEHGGVAPVIVAADAALATMVPLLVKGGFYHAGQVCVSVQRIYVQNRLKEELVAALVEQVAALAVGDPLVATTQVGPLIRPREVERVAEWVSQAVVQGAKCALGGSALSERFYHPTVLVDPDPRSKVSCEEVFGPVVTVTGYDDEAEALALANSLPWAFQAAVFSGDRQRAGRLAAGLEATAVMINDHTAFRVDWMPFGGKRVSGLGVGGIPDAVAAMSPEKLIVERAT